MTLSLTRSVGVMEGEGTIYGSIINILKVIEKTAAIIATIK